MAQIIPLGFVTASDTALTSNVPAKPGYPLRCNKVLVQAFKTANSSDSVFVGLTGFNKTTGAGVIAVLQLAEWSWSVTSAIPNVLDPTQSPWTACRAPR